MKLKKLVPLVTSNRLADLRAFYTTHFGFTVTMETEHYLALSAEGNGEIAFMRSDTYSPEEFNGHGVLICLEVANVDAEAERLSKANLPVVVPLQDNPWCDRSIVYRDPAGLHVYVYHCK